MRICIAPVDVASYYAGLRQGFLAAGTQVWFFPFEKNPYSRYRPDAGASLLERLVFRISGLRTARATSWWRWLWHRALDSALRVIVLLVALGACDVFVFGFGQTFLGRAELPLLRFLRKRIIFVFNGSDSRPVWMSGLAIHGAQALGPPQAVASIRRQSRMLRWIEHHATECIGHPLSSQLHRRRFINHLVIGHPCPPPPATTTLTDAMSRPVRILHAPSKCSHKGSDAIRQMIATLRAEGCAIDFVELTGRPNDEVLRSIAECDLVIDELYSDIPLAGLGSEAASAGKPALVGGYGQREIAKHAEGVGLPCALYVHPDHLLATARRLIADRDWRRACGSQAARFVTEQWSSLVVARRFLRLIRQRAPGSWYVDPARLRYWQGWGASEAQTLAFIAAIVRRQGMGTLGISHNPAMEAELAALIARRSGTETR